MNVLVTGGAGYIGSHVVLELVEEGHDVTVVDNLTNGHHRLVADEASLIVFDIGDEPRLRGLFDRKDFDAVMHFAGSIVVPESVEEPLKYYLNNTAKSRTLVECCVDTDVEYFVFSSTAAVYGEPDEIPVDESAPTEPVNPYGRSKLMIEWMLEDACAAHELEAVRLRYFNVAGADPKGRTGQIDEDSTHLIKVATQTALGERSKLSIFGTDYPTDDGTCIRDFIHVSDLADVHVRALDYLSSGGKSRALNCGYGHGFSVRDVVESVHGVSGSDFDVEDAARRPGDPPEIVADPSALIEIFGWEPRYDDLDFIVETALEWEKTDC